MALTPSLSWVVGNWGAERKESRLDAPRWMVLKLGTLIGRS
jgi:hypothetical protein